MWEAHGASEIASTHIWDDLPNQDSFGVEFVGGAMICVVSDGAGSCKYADEGSKFAAVFTVDFLRKLLEEAFDFSDEAGFAKKIR
jgi:hypothetical protein